MKVVLVLEGPVCADQEPDLPWIRGLAKAHVCEVERERTHIQIALGCTIPPQDHESPSHLGKARMGQSWGARVRRS